MKIRDLNPYNFEYSYDANKNWYKVQHINLRKYANKEFLQLSEKAFNQLFDIVEIPSFDDWKKEIEKLEKLKRIMS